MRSLVKTGSLCMLVLLLLLLELPVAIAPSLPARLYDASSGVYAGLIDKLVEEGHDRSYLSRIFAPGNDIFYQRLTKINLIQKEYQDPYRRMFNQAAIRSIRAFLNKHKSAFDAGEQKYGVDREFIAAIMFVESRFGTVAGENLVLYVLSSMSLAEEEWNIRALTEELDKEFPDMSPSERSDKIRWLRSRARSKSRWAYRELTTLLQLRHSHDMEAEQLRGSWAGAFGIPQFLPTSFAAYAVDGDQNGLVDIYTIEDAIASVANYLYKNGWRGTMTRKKQRTVIWRYNHSWYYVDLIEDLAEAV